MSNLLKWLNAAFGIKSKSSTPARRTSAAPAHAKPAAAPSSPSGAPSFHWTDDGNFDVEVVGESHYQDALRSLAGNHGDRSVEIPCKALLVPEDSNKHDNKAVAVYIDGNQAGYLSSDAARSFRRRLGRKNLSGQITSTDAVIRGGGFTKEKRYSYGVWLDMKPFD